MLKSFSSFFLCALVAARVVASEDDYLVCKPLQSLFAHVSNTVNATKRGPQGTPGKRGPRGYVGPPGPQGPTGPKAVVNWKEVDNLINNKLEAHFNCSGMIYGQNCYRLPYKAMTYNNRNGKLEAERLCAFHGGTLVDFENEKMYNRLKTYILNTWVIYVDKPTVNFVGVWIASTYQNGEIRSATGSEVWYPGHPSAIDWYPGYPAAGRSDIALQVATKPNERTGIWTPRTSESHLVPLCRIPIN